MTDSLDATTSDHEGRHAFKAEEKSKDKAKPPDAGVQSRGDPGSGHRPLQKRPRTLGRRLSLRDPTDMDYREIARFLRFRRVR